MEKDKDQDITSDKDPITAVARKEKELIAHDLERARDGNDLGEKFGRQNISSTTTSKVALESKKKEDEKCESIMRQLLQQMREELARRLEELDGRIAETNAKIEELRGELETTEALLKKQFGDDWLEKLKRGELDPNDPLLRQWLLQQQQLKDYLERRERLIQERNELERRIAEIEGSNLSDDFKLEKMKEILDGGTSAGVHKVWQRSEVSDQVRQLAANKHTEDYAQVAAEEFGNGLLVQFAGVSFAAKAGIGDSEGAITDTLRSKFAAAAEPGEVEKPELIASIIPTFKGPKVPG